MVVSKTSLKDTKDIMSTDQELAQFHKLCSVSLFADDNQHLQLCVSANVHDRSTGEFHEFKRCVNLTPLMETIADKIRDYHLMLHSDMSVGASSLDYLRQTRQALLNKISRDQRTTKGGQWKSSPSQGSLINQMNRSDRAGASRMAAQEARTPLLSASQDSQDTYTDDDVKNKWAGINSDDDNRRVNRYLDAPENLPPLSPDEDPLEVQGWFDSIKNTAVNLAHNKAVKGLYHELKHYGTWAKDHQKEIAAAAAATGFGAVAAGVMTASFKAYDALQAAKRGNHEAIKALKGLKTLADSGHHEAQQTLDAVRHMNEMMKAKAAGQSPMKVTGWLYNKPYRTNLQVISDAANGKFPTLGIAMREGWHDGLAFAGFQKRKNYTFLGI
jgi:hypothetical protein